VQAQLSITVLDFLLICLGGGLGSILRAVMTARFARRLSVAGATLVINLSGSFLIGLALAASFAPHPLLEGMGLLVATAGFLGGFTTVSGFALQVLELARGGRWRGAGALACGTLAGCVLAAFAGLHLGRIFLGGI
jgi:fluoride exporter